MSCTDMYAILNNGCKMPLVGLGTWQATPEEVKATINCCLECGYRHIDTAYSYENEAAIGDALQEWLQSGKIKREEIFVVTKLPLIGNRPERVEYFLKQSLEKLKLEYVDLYLIHFPCGLKYYDDKKIFPVKEDGKIDIDQDTDLVALWKAMEVQVDQGRVKSIGLSNFSGKQIRKIIDSCRIKPANLQVELHLYFQQKSLRKVCDEYGITVCAYGPLGSRGRIQFNEKRGLGPPTIPSVLQDSIVLKLAAKYSKTPAQILLRHLIQQQIIVIPKSSSPTRIHENFQVFDFSLTENEIEELNSLDKGENGRSFAFDVFKGMSEHPEFPF